MSLSVIIPAKSLHMGKSRLSTLLSAEERYSLNKYLLRRTLRVARQLVSQENLIVVSGCKETLEFAGESATPLEEKVHGLNPALEQVSDYARSRGASRLLILPTDLPFMDIEDLHSLINECGVVLVPDRPQKGTNVLFLNMSGKFNYQFGEDSLRLHMQESNRLGLKPSLIQNENLAFDLDTPADYQLFSKPLTFLHAEGEVCKSLGPSPHEG